MPKNQRRARSRVMPLVAGTATLLGLGLGLGGCGEHIFDDSLGGSAGMGGDTASADGGGVGPFPGLPPNDSACGLITPDGTAGSMFAPPPVVLDGVNVVESKDTPPAISGGTLLVMADSQTVVGSDPDRDQLYVIDAASHKLVHTVALSKGEEPGRLAEGAAGEVYVVLRGGAAIGALDVKSGALRRMPTCALPRGLAFDAAAGNLHVACADGKLETLSAAAGKVSRTLELGRDLRDVVMSEGKLFVSRFRSAELMRIDANGTMSSRYTPPTLETTEESFVQEDACGAGKFEMRTVEQAPNVVWRTLAVPDHGVMMLHQRSRTTEVSTQQGGYGGGSCGSGIVQTALTMNADKQDGVVYPAIDSTTLAVDMAVDSDASFIAIAAPGNWGSLPQVTLFTLANVQQQVLGMMGDGGVAGSTAADAGGFVTMSPPGCVAPNAALDTSGQAVALAFVSPHVLAVQTREPATLELFDLRTMGPIATISLSSETRMDTGHTMFHLRAGAGVACASCHAEGGDDGHVWTFQDIGPRRTQHLRGGILGTEPFHWDGDLSSFDKLMSDVFVGRMSGFAPSQQQTLALSRWIDRQPLLHAAPSDALSAERGRVLFESKDVGCTSCHSGTQLTNNTSMDVGTGKALQVPSLRGVSFRAPFMHDGCAATLLDRFGDCGGGEAHGNTSDLSDTELTDLVSYLESL